MYRSYKKLPYVMSGDGTIFTPKYGNSFDKEGLEAALRKLRKETGFPLKKERRVFDNHND